MNSVLFENSDFLDFAKIFIDQISRLSGPDAASLSSGNEVTFADQRIGWLFQRLSDGQSTVLPFPGSRIDSWLVTGPVLSDLDAELNQICRFVVPSYAAFAGDTSRRQTLEFETTGPRLQQLGARLGFPGYYRWESPPSNRDIILDRLSLWRDLMARRPPVQRVGQPTYAELEEKFREALVLHDWPGAANALTALRQLNVTSAENLLFLEFILAARQRQWLKIWEHPNFEIVADLRLPRSVRSAMLDAVHQVVLAPLEEIGDRDSAVRAFEESQPRLGHLLLSRAGLRTESAIRVFAYQAVAADDPALMDELLNEDISPTVREQLQVLASKMTHQVSAAAEVEDSDIRLRTVLEQGDIDSAYLIALNTENPVEQVARLVQVTIQSRDELHVREALRRYDSLVQESAEILEKNYPFIGEVLAGFRGQLSLPESERGDSERSILNWPEWLRAAARDPMAPYLATSLDLLPSEYDEREWADTELEELFYGLAAVQETPEVIALSHVERALTKLSDVMMSDDRFPRMDAFHQDVYEQLFDVLIKDVPAPGRATRALDLAAAILEKNPQRIDEFAVRLTLWYDRPQPRLEDQACAMVELLADFGVTPSTLAPWYRKWAEYLLRFPADQDWTSATIWRSLGVWTEAGPDLIAEFDKIAEEQSDKSSPVRDLEPGFTIVIFTLRLSSARRVRDLMLKQNSVLDIEICSETDLNSRVKALAERANLPVVVTSCISHALTYGISPHLQAEPVYPPSSGSAGILRSIEAELAAKSS